MTHDRSSCQPRELIDYRLARGVMARDPGAVALVVTRLSPKVRGVVRRLGGAQLDVEDAVQDVFLKLCKNVKHLRDPLAMEAFVMAIAVRTAQRSGRRARVRQSRFIPILLESDQRSRVDVGAEHALSRLQGALARVSKKDRDVFVLKSIAGMRIRDVAAQLNISVTTVRRRWLRASARLTFFARKDLFLADYLRNLES